MLLGFRNSQIICCEKIFDGKFLIEKTPCEIHNFLLSFFFLIVLANHNISVNKRSQNSRISSNVETVIPAVFYFKHLLYFKEMTNSWRKKEKNKLKSCERNFKVMKDF